MSFKDLEATNTNDPSFGEDDEHHNVTRVRTSGDNGEYVHLGGKRYLKSELIYAFGGNFNPGVQVAPHVKFGNPTPMGLFSFATTTLILSFANAGARRVHNHGMMLGVALFYGGAVQIIAGIMELIIENSFGATVFTAYGGFWMSFAVLTMNGFNIASSYETPKELDNALGLYLLTWGLVTFFFWVCTIRSTAAMFTLMGSLTTTFILLASSNFTAGNGSGTVSNHLNIAGGVVGCFTAMVAYYNAMAGLLTKENSWIAVKPIFMPGAIRPPSEKEKEA